LLSKRSTHSDHSRFKRKMKVQARTLSARHRWRCNISRLQRDLIDCFRWKTMLQLKLKKWLPENKRKDLKFIRWTALQTCQWSRRKQNTQSISLKRSRRKKRPSTHLRKSQKLKSKSLPSLRLDLSKNSSRRSLKSSKMSHRPWLIRLTAHSLKKSVHRRNCLQIGSKSARIFISFRNLAQTYQILRKEGYQESWTKNSRRLRKKSSRFLVKRLKTKGLFPGRAQKMLRRLTREKKRAWTISLSGRSQGWRSNLLKETKRAWWTSQSSRSRKSMWNNLRDPQILWLKK